MNKEEAQWLQKALPDCPKCKGKGRVRTTFQTHVGGNLHLFHQGVAPCECRKRPITPAGPSSTFPDSVG